MFRAFPKYENQKASYELYLKYYNHGELHDLGRKLELVAENDARQGTPATLEGINQRIRRYTLGSLGYGSFLIYLRAFASALAKRMSRQIKELARTQAYNGLREPWPAELFAAHYHKVPDADFFYERYLTNFWEEARRASARRAQSLDPDQPTVRPHDPQTDSLGFHSKWRQGLSEETRRILRRHNLEFKE